MTATSATLPSTRPRRRPSATSDFTALTQQVHDAGLMRRRHGYYWVRLVGSAAAVALWTVAFVWLGDTWWQLVSVAVLSVLLTQIAFLGHDAAHRQIFASGRWNDWTSLVLANLFVGISYGWWQSKHSKHHAAPNTMGSDPDIDFDTPALTPAATQRHPSRFGQWMMRHQGWYFFPLLLLEGLSLHVNAVQRVTSREPVRRRWVEITFLAVRLGGFLTLLLLVLPPGKAAVALAVQLAVFGLYMGAAFAPNHIGMPLVAAGLKLDFLRRQVLVSRNVSGGRPMAVLMGGLNYQIEHHLFPSMARPHLRQLQPMVEAHCRELGVPYTQTSLWRSYGIVLRYLNTVGLKSQDPFLCPLVAQRRAPLG